MSDATPDSHEGFTRMLFIDALAGVGLPTFASAIAASDQGLAYFCGDQHNPEWAWDSDALEKLSIETLQDLYTSIKLHKVKHAG